jgi:hypothetical protein
MFLDFFLQPAVSPPPREGTGESKQESPQRFHGHVGCQQILARFLLESNR